MKNKEFTLPEREELSRSLAQGKTLSEVAKRLNKHRSSVFRETNRAGMDRYSYRAHKAHWHAIRQKKQQGRKRKMNQCDELKQFVLNGLRMCWSPKQIANDLKLLYPGNMAMQISHEAIYSYVYVLGRGSLKKELLSCLRQQKKKRRKKRKKLTGEEKQAKQAEKRGQIPEMISIDERPKEVEDRIIPGHWEGDLIMGKWKRSALGTLVERTTRTVILVPLGSNKSAVDVRKAFAKEMKSLPKQMKISLTYDQGKEMTEHRLFTKQTKIKVYFAHPGSPWERGTNENTNGLIRQFFPKGTDFCQVSRRKIKHVQDLLNGRPRKVLDWRKPYEVFNKLINSVAIET